MRSRDEVLKDINAELPPFDWRAGARRYVDDYFARFGIDQVEAFALTKPLSPITAEDPQGSLTEVVSYLHNFASALELLQLTRGARVLDVACGAGWVSHWLTKLGYDTFGIDISADFVALARKRLAQDPALRLTADAARPRFACHDIETAPLDPERGRFDAVILESCLHHFFDPIAALTHIAAALADGGVVLIIEGENRRGPIRPEYMQVMVETQTLERPYPRELLLEVLDHAGLAHREFLASLSGYVPVSSAAFADGAGRLQAAAEEANICVCATRPEALRRVVPSYVEPPRKGGRLAALFRPRSAPAAAPAPSASAAQDEPPPELLSLGFAAGGDGASVLAGGWWAPESEGVWSDGPAAAIRLPELPAGARDVEIELEAMGYTAPGGADQRVEVSLAGRSVATWQARPNGWRRYRLDVPAELAARLSGASLDFAFPDAVSPAVAEPGSSDPRALGMAVRRLTVRARIEAPVG